MKEVLIGLFQCLIVRMIQLANFKGDFNFQSVVDWSTSVLMWGLYRTKCSIIESQGWRVMWSAQSLQVDKIFTNRSTSAEVWLLFITIVTYLFWRHFHFHLSWYSSTTLASKYAKNYYFLWGVFIHFRLTFLHKWLLVW